MSTLKTTNIAHPSSASNNIVLDSSARVLVGTSSTSATTTAIFQGNSGDGATGAGTIYLGRGVTTPDDGNQLGAINFSDSTHTNSGQIIAQRDGGTWSASSKPTRLTFSTTADSASSPTERMRIGQLGYTKISNAASYNNLSGEYHEFNGSAADWTAYVRNTNANPAGLIVRYSGAAPNGTSNEFLYCSDTGVLRLAVRSNGGIANYSGNDANLCDEREKKNIVNLDSTWDCLKHWELKKFHYNEDADTDDLRYGVIAQQIADYCPEVITDWVKQKAEPAKLDEDGTEIEPAKEEIARLGVKEQQMMWMAIKALQEAQLRIEILEAEVAALKAS
jgi:hypothetical protein